MNKIMSLLIVLFVGSFIYGMEEDQKPFQKNPLLLFPEVKERALAFAMATHSVLGANSPANRLPREIVQAIACWEVYEWLNQNYEAIKRLRDSGQEAKDDSLFKALGRNGNVNDFIIAMCAGADVNIVDAADESPLLIAIHRGDTVLARILIQGGANVNATNSLKWFSPLHCAARDNHPEIVALLIDSGAYVNFTNSLGWSPLHYAAVNGNTEVVRILLAAGADRKMKIVTGNYAGMTAAEMARAGLPGSRGHYALAEFIEQWEPGQEQHEVDASAPVIQPEINIQATQTRLRSFVTNPLTLGTTAAATIVGLAVLWRCIHR